MRENEKSKGEFLFTTYQQGGLVEMKKILLIATGGTIASVLTPDGLHPSVTPSELLNILPELKELCETRASLLVEQPFW